MNKTSKGLRNFSSALLVGAATAAALVAVSPAFAENTETVVVTGSRIPRSDFVSQSPVTVVTGDQINMAGNLNLGEVLRQGLGVGGGAGGSFGQSNNLNGAGASSIDLRDLGSDRVLNLINGRRVASFADDLQNVASDLSFIPMAMVDRVEVLRDGASSVYGADAVSGVVNIILKKDFQGLQLSAQEGISDKGDRQQTAIQAVMGVNIDRGNIVLSAEYNNQDLVPQRDRSWAATSITSLTKTGYTVGSGYHPGGLFYFDDGSMWCTTPKAYGGDEITNTYGTSACPNTPSTTKRNGAGGRYDYAQVQSILGGNQVINIAEYGTYKVTPDIEYFLESEVSVRHSQEVLDGNPIAAGSTYGAFSNGWTVPGNNPYNPDPGVMAYVQIRPTDTIGARNSTYDARMLRAVTGFRGEKLLGMFNWEVSYDYTEVSGKATTDATVNLRRAITISDPALCAADPNCVLALKPGSLGALDVYRPGNWSQSEINYMKQIATSNSLFKLEDIQGNIGGDIFDLPAGPLAINVGWEYRKESVDFRPDAVTESGESVANQTFSTKGSFTVREAYGEVNIPVLAKQFLAESVTVNLQGRVFNYSNFGTASVYKGGIDWNFTDWIRARATYGTSFRAPNLTELFSGGTVSYEFLNDPCDPSMWTGTYTATVKANCVAAGANPATYTQSAPQLSVLSGGDIVDGKLDLTPERARTWTIGTVIAPQGILDGLKVSVDYWSIHISNYIGSVDTQTEILDKCYQSVGMSDPTCATFSRNATSHQLTGLTSYPINRNELISTSGLDWTVSYALELYGGTLNLENEMSWKLGYNLFPGAGYCGSSSAECVPLLQGSISADYEIGDWAFTWRTNYIEGMKDEQVVHPNYLNYNGPGDYFVHDVRIRWDVVENFKFTVGVNNVFGKDPPYVFNTGNNTNTALYGEAVVGRYFFMRATATF